MSNRGTRRARVNWLVVVIVFALVMIIGNLAKHAGLPPVIGWGAAVVIGVAIGAVAGWLS